MKKILYFAANTLIALVLMIGLLIAASFLPIKNNYKLYSVMSGSMEPIIPTGSLAVVVPQNNYHPGDIVTFISNGASSSKDTTTHRITNVSQDGSKRLYSTKGDANKSSDAKPVPENKVVGKYIFGIALIGYLMKYLTTLTGLILLILLPSTIIILEELASIANEAKRIKINRKLSIERNR